MYRANSRRLLETYQILASRRAISTQHPERSQAKKQTLGGRSQELEVDNLALRYPRIGSYHRKLSCKSFIKQFDYLQKGETYDDEEIVVCGRLLSYRTAGSKLVFIDVYQEGKHVQGLCDFRKFIEGHENMKDFASFLRQLHRGDVMSLQGKPHRTPRGELSLEVNRTPTLLAPCLHALPTDLQDEKTRMENRHIDFLVNPQIPNIIRMRSEVIQFVRQHLIREEHIEVQTPILASGAGGAAARSFKTSATEFPSRKMNLRIAPELWLKRLVIGGFDRVFEIGPSFRNEGIDLIHNPEFTTCEFYRAFADLEELIASTETMLSGLAEHLQTISPQGLPVSETGKPIFSVPFKRIHFVPTLQSAIGCRLPDLSSSNALHEVTQIFLRLDIPLPETPRLPYMLDRLSSIYLEPLCSGPTFILNHPECMSPLAKSYEDPELGQRISARAELFVGGQEMVNTYEEENSPFEQRRKFIEQKGYSPKDHEAEIDENYIEALEWGLPPTGGWGCGIDRLCMMMLGVKRIGDVLTFGTLRNVVALGKTE